MKIEKNSKGIKFSIKVVPKSSCNSISVMEEDTIKVKITSPPVDGKANEACIKFLADVLGVSKSDIKIVSGLKAKVKLIEASGDADLLYSRLQQAFQSR